MNESLTKIRLVAMDLDGTLLDPQGRVSLRNLEALEAAARLGVELVPVSARPGFGVEHALNGFMQYRFIVAYNGAYIYERHSGEVVLNQTMEPDDILEMLELVHQYGFYAGYYAGEEFFAEIDGAGARLEEYFLGRGPHFVPRLTDVVQDYPANKVIVLEPEHPERLEPFYQEGLRKLKNVSMNYSSFRSIEISCKDVSKGSGLKFMADRLGLMPDQVMAIGDNENDLSMLAYAGISVAMGNATPEVRASSSLVVSSSEEDGVAEAIERMILDVSSGRD